MVVEYRTVRQDQFVRVHRQGNQVGDFMVRRHEIEGLSPAEIQRKFSIPEEPTLVSDVIVPSGTRVRTGSVEANFGGRSGATQYQLADKIDVGNFDNARPIAD